MGLLLNRDTRDGVRKVGWGALSRLGCENGGGKEETWTEKEKGE